MSDEDLLVDSEEISGNDTIDLIDTNNSAINASFEKKIKHITEELKIDLDKINQQKPDIVYGFLKAMFKQQSYRLPVRPPNNNCKHCWGKGYKGWRDVAVKPGEKPIKFPVPCPCVMKKLEIIQKTADGKEIEAEPKGFKRP